MTNSSPAMGAMETWINDCDSRDLLGPRWAEFVAVVREQDKIAGELLDALQGLMAHESGLGGATSCDRTRNQCPHWSLARKAIMRGEAVL